MMMRLMIPQNIFSPAPTMKRPRPGGSRKGKAANIERGSELAAIHFHNGYFVSEYTYRAHMFTQRFRLTPNIFKIITRALRDTDTNFPTRADCTGRQVLSAH